MSVTSTFAVPVPTPYQSPQYGGSPFAPVGQQGPYMSPTQQYQQPIGPGMGTYGVNDIFKPVNTLGATDANSNPTPPSSPTNNTGGGGSWRDYPGYAGWDPAAAEADFAATGGAGKGGTSGSGFDFNAGYNDYVGQLDSILNNLTGQRSSQEQIAQNQFSQGLGSLDLSKTQGQQLLDKQKAEAQTNQAKNLKDLSSNLRNSFMAGNIYLGSRGAGDSSAANQYSYALTKLGNQQRGDIMSQTGQIMNDINDRATNLQNVYATEKKNLETQLNSNLQSIGQWFSEQQNNLSLQKGNAAREQSKQALNYAMQQLQTVQQEAANKRAMLDQWAMNNSKTIQELQSNMAQIPSSGYSLPTSQPLTEQPVTDAGGNLSQNSYYGGGGGTVNPDKQKALQNIWNIGSGNWWR